MALPKELKAKIEAWKEGKGEYPEELDHGSFFENDGVLQKVINGKLGPAQKAARAEAEAQFLEALGIDDPEKLKEIKQKLAEAAGTVTEVEKSRATIAKMERDWGKDKERLKSLEGFQVKVLKGQALEPHLSKVAEPFRTLVRENLEGKLEIKGDKVLAPGEIEVDAYFDDYLKANPSLKVPDTKAGAGTGPSGGKSKGDNAGAGSGASGGSSGGQSNGTDPKFPKDLGAAFASVLREKAGGETAQ